MLEMIKRLAFWTYGRSTWQYDVLCVMILAFIFLSPQSWFNTGKPRFDAAHRNESAKASRLLLLTAESLAAQSDSSGLKEPNINDIEQRVRALPEHENVVVRGARPVKTQDGRIVAYEVDIR